MKCVKIFFLGTSLTFLFCFIFNIKNICYWSYILWIFIFVFLEIALSHVNGNAELRQYFGIRVV